MKDMTAFSRRETADMESLGPEKKVPLIGVLAGSTSLAFWRVPICTA
jgi:hypothetical protein